ncbi:methyl-accepting chemotaxis protein [Pararhodospirillum oryzae]|uniref:Methyl-accepting chemotaxis protein n=1 Tax=Pararhodospirillum oryzae TaxID=478448 RepID=A0A512H7T8_9PROT|nr:methyl-accepting chemotaxis protein [Pararhodospirillum oryzae]GEO81501.1 hypothetical protein ROR02_16320 [Pararhodospirillum oryzae]
MRDNGPITDREIELGDDAIIVSGTDTRGIITFANEEFVTISGYSPEELFGAPHNILRHPHMPREAFADLWATVKAGRSWEGMVKNRTKNGDFYWVRANVTPTMSGSEVTGYISIRTKPERAAVTEAERIYALFREGRARGLAIHEGRVISTTWIGRLVRLRDSVVGRLGVVLLVLGVLGAGIGVVGIDGMRAINQDLNLVFDRNVRAVIDLATLVELSDDVARQVDLMEGEMLRGLLPTTLNDRLGTIEGRRKAFTILWENHLKGEHSEAEKELQRRVTTTWEALWKEGVPEALELARGGDREALSRKLATRTRPQFVAVHGALHDLVNQQRTDAAALRERAEKEVSWRLLASVGLLVGGGALGLALSAWFLVSLHRPLRRMERHFDAIAAGNLGYVIPSPGLAELDNLSSRLRALKARIGYYVLERAEMAKRSEEELRREMMALTNLLEGEVQETVGDISVQSSRLSENAANLAQVAERLLHDATQVTESVRITSANVQTVAGATEQLEASSREISERVDSGARLAETARAKGDEALHRVESLTEATARIDSVVGLIQGIAGQTRMLSLNATIEAARAGEAGKGFSVVAGEVKGLAGETEHAIGTISEQAEGISRTTGEAARTVQAVVESIRAIDTITADVARAAGEQRAATAEIMSSAAQAAEHTGAVAESVQGMREGAETTGAVSTRVRDLASRVNRDILALRQRLYVILRSSHGGNRRQYPRIPVALRYKGTFGSNTFSGMTADLSQGGALVVVAQGSRPSTGRGSLDIEGVGELAAEVVTVSENGLHLKFRALDPEQIERLKTRIEKAVADDIPMVEHAVGFAKTVAEVFEHAIAEGRITSEDLFDGSYTPIPGTNPVQYMAPHTALAEAELGPLIARLAGAGGSVPVCVATDRNGYIAAHMPEHSKPQRPDDPEWNQGNSRNRRLYNDRAGILAARCTKPMTQTYRRDMGGGTIVLMKEIDAPIMVLGRRWGAVRQAGELLQ